MKEKRISLSVLISCVIITAALTAGLILCLVPNPLRGRLTNSDSLSKYYEIKSLIDDYFVEEISDGELARALEYCNYIYGSLLTPLSQSIVDGVQLLDAWLARD